MIIIIPKKNFFFRKFHTISAKEWTNVFHKELSATPVLVCLTHADKLCEESDDYMNFFTADKCNETEMKEMATRFAFELNVSILYRCNIISFTFSIKFSICT